MQSNLEYRADLHVAIIMDGNGRWATARGMPRVAGHRAGAGVVREIVQSAPSLGVAKLTLFAFSSDNWRRPQGEVAAIMALLARYLRRERRQFADAGVRLSVIGRRDRLPLGLAEEIADAERLTASGRRLHLRLAVDYSARAAILDAARRLAEAAEPTPERFGALISPDSAEDTVDLLIRSGGEKRLSDFLLWESAYAELFFTDKMWPDFSPDDLKAAVADFRRRDRCFGGLARVASSAGRIGDDRRYDR
jgi:undecaprenyl diphosphate synthase